ncbi:DEAD/DEAH box helicase [Methyloligella halotolerans]|uniref:DEAD/DEAH box helicase n=1 Tax=Methyloligella halotolerans TaxID=1177755 RepID=UPI00083CB799|nr:DEAD/DEAH box helicase [Methyloligella halotolerans]
MTNTFDDLGLAEPLRLAVKAEKYTTPTPIQTKAIPAILDGGDLLAVADTGSGKTAAFSLPLLHRLAADRGPRTPGAPRALILAPTRELAAQIGESIDAYGRGLKLRSTIISGGVGYGQQFKALKGNVDILVATPGRLLELMTRSRIRLDRVSMLVLDEADRMLDMGFVREVRKIAAACPKQRQTLLFSATMPPPIATLAKELLHDALRIDVAPRKVETRKIEQRVYFVGAADKKTLLLDLVNGPDVGQAIVFTRTKRGADRIYRHLVQEGVTAEALHGNKAQNARVKALNGFRGGKIRILVATDIAARGIDVPGLSHVINFDMPNEPESYVHRIGRTGRAGAQGIAMSFCDTSEGAYLKAIERLTRTELEVSDHPFALAPSDVMRQQPKSKAKSGPKSKSGRPKRKFGGRPVSKGRGRYRGDRPNGAPGAAARMSSERIQSEHAI